uniref:Uncharacterized protein n=1 Tax=Romanomermis culicivorax TaxID=13658 RepID=A0A915HNW0_ROMCU
MWANLRYRQATRATIGDLSELAKNANFSSTHAYTFDVCIPMDNGISGLSMMSIIHIRKLEIDCNIHSIFDLFFNPSREIKKTYGKAFVDIVKLAFGAIPET